MGETKPKKRIWLRVLCIVLAVIIAIAAALGITVWCVWGNENFGDSTATFRYSFGGGLVQG